MGRLTGPSYLSSSGEIGRRAGLGYRWGGPGKQSPCRFKSGLLHHFEVTEMAGLSMSCSFDRPAKLLILFNRLGVQAQRSASNRLQALDKERSGKPPTADLVRQVPL